MVHRPSGRARSAGAAIVMLLLASCTTQRGTTPRPDPVEPAAASHQAPAPAPSQDAAGDSARVRALEGVGIPPEGARRACELAARVRLDADSVALRFTAAFMKLGIMPIRLSLPSVDGVTAGPVDVTTPAPARISARATTEMRNDSTAYSVEVRVGPTGQGWARGDSAVAVADAGELCRRVVGLAFP